jgi:hypothetical protein
LTNGLFTEADAPVSIEAQIACVERELVFREKCYPKWVAEKRMTQKLADREIASMRAVLATLKGLA